VKPDVWDIVTIAGLAALTYGLHQVYPPAAWIVVGLMVMVFGIRGARPAGAGGAADGD
jgi:hypothetical protein